MQTNIMPLKGQQRLPLVAPANWRPLPAANGPPPGFGCARELGAIFTQQVAFSRANGRRPAPRAHSGRRDFRWAAKTAGPRRAFCARSAGLSWRPGRRASGDNEVARADAASRPNGRRHPRQQPRGRWGELVGGRPPTGGARARGATAQASSNGESSQAPVRSPLARLL